MELTAQAFAPDAGALVVTEGGWVVRVELPSGAATRIAADPYGPPRAAWSATGRIAVTVRLGILVQGLGALIRSTKVSDQAALWSGDGTTLRYVIPGDDTADLGGDGSV